MYLKLVVFHKHKHTIYRYPHEHYILKNIFVFSECTNFFHEIGKNCILICQYESRQIKISQDKCTWIFVEASKYSPIRSLPNDRTKLPSISGIQEVFKLNHLAIAIVHKHDGCSEAQTLSRVSIWSEEKLIMKSSSFPNSSLYLLYNTFTGTFMHASITHMQEYACMLSLSLIGLICLYTHWFRIENKSMSSQWLWEDI